MEAQVKENLPAINIDSFKEIVSKAPDVLKMNQTSLANASNAGNKLFALIEKDGMSDLYDAELAKYVGKLKDALDNMNTRRKPFTQLVDHFKKMFTTAEAEIKPLQDKAQKLRNDYATKKMNEQREREKQAQLKLDQEKERIEIKKRVAIIISGGVGNHELAEKQALNKTLEAASLDTIESIRKIISEWPISLGKETFDGIRVDVTALYLTSEDVSSIIAETRSELFVELMDKYQSSITAYKREMIDKIPSKKKELEELAISDAQESEKILLEQQKRQKEEEERILREQEENRRKIETEANLKATAETTNAMVNNQAEISFDQKPQVKEGYEIILKNTAAYLVLAQFWFDKEGKSWTTEKVEKMTFARIKKFCEEYATKNDEKVNSPFVEYKEIFKAK